MRNLILSGGIAHDYAATSPMLASILSESGIDSEIREDFTIMDELYTNPVTVDRVDPLMTADWEGETHPMLWVREYGNARVCYCAPGHGVETFENSVLRAILQRVVRSECAGNKVYSSP